VLRERLGCAALIARRELGSGPLGLTPFVI
jgi:hypothetical protein